MYMSCYKAQQIPKTCFFSLQGMREDASFSMLFEKVSSHYEEGEVSVEIVSIIEEYYHQIFVSAELLY